MPRWWNHSDVIENKWKNIAVKLHTDTPWLHRYTKKVVNPHLRKAIKGGIWFWLAMENRPNCVFELCALEICLIYHVVLWGCSRHNASWINQYELNAILLLLANGWYRKIANIPPPTPWLVLFLGSNFRN